MSHIYDSDSEPEQNIRNGKVSEEDQPHVKEIIEKGKKILPSYDDEALYGLYKRYYSVENVFINEIQMIARRLKGDQETDEGRRRDDKWINVGREVKTKVNKSKYNFLEDKDLLRRANQYLKTKILLPERRPNFNNDERRPANGPRDNYRPRNEQPNNQSFRQQKPKQKYVEKVQDKTAENVQEQKSQVETTKKVEPTPITKVEVPVVQTKVEAPKVEENKTVTQQKPPASKVQKTQEASKKEEPVKQSQPAPKQRYVEVPASKPVESKPVQQKPVQQKPVQQKPVQQKPAQKPQVNIQTQKPSAQTPAKQTQNVSVSHSIPTVQNFDPVLAANNFEQACSQNSFILKFIQPQNYPQRISYIRTEDGGMKNVQIRVTGTSTGSQKKL